MATWGQQISNVAVRALLHRITAIVSVDVSILLAGAAQPGETVRAQQRLGSAELAAAKRGLALMQADAALLQRRLASYQSEAAKWQARAEAALRAGDALLARQALARKGQVQRVAGQYADEYAAQQRSLVPIRAAVEQLEAHVGQARPVRALVQLDHDKVDARFAQLELDQAMNELRQTVHGR